MDMAWCCFDKSVKTEKIWIFVQQCRERRLFFFFVFFYPKMVLNSSANLALLLLFSLVLKLGVFCLFSAIAKFWFADVYLSIGGGRLLVLERVVRTNGSLVVSASSSSS